MDLDRTTTELLRPAADRLRRALQRMDDDDVPTSLRSLADTSARRLPPPLLKRALTELDESEWLRAEVAAEGDLEVGSPEDLFVRRPADWQARMAELAIAAGEKEEARNRSGLERRLSDALSRIAELEQIVKSGAEEVAAAERRARHALQAQVESAERARRDAEKQARDDARTAARLASQAELLQAELEAAEGRLEGLRELLKRERRSPSTTQTDGSARGWFPDDPSAMGEELDRILSAVRRRPTTDEPITTASEELRIPEGLRPDRVEVIHWLMRRSVRWLIDGYNVAFQVADEPDSTTRARLAGAAGTLSTLASPGSTVVVVFDSTVDTSSLPTNRRVRVVYAHSADDWIVEHAGPRTVVVSSDRRVREQSEHRGAIGVWSEAMAAWIESGTTRG